MKCPACEVEIYLDPRDLGVWIAPDYDVTRQGTELAIGTCPRGNHAIVVLRRGKHVRGSGEGEEWLATPIVEQVIFPKGSPRSAPSEVPEQLRADFAEASAVLPESAKASAAISRRILQQLLVDHFGVKSKDLAAQIAEFIQSTNVPTYLAEAVDAVRHVGNLAAHPVKNQHTGEIVSVEPGEAEWLLDVLESMFDFVFVQPARLAANRAALEAKLSAAGKPPLQRPTKKGTA